MTRFGQLRNAGCPEGEEPGYPFSAETSFVLGVNGTVNRGDFGQGVALDIKCNILQMH